MSHEITDKQAEAMQTYIQALANAAKTLEETGKMTNFLAGRVTDMALRLTELGKATGDLLTSSGEVETEQPDE